MVVSGSVSGRGMSGRTKQELAGSEERSLARILSEEDHLLQ